MEQVIRSSAPLHHQIAHVLRLRLESGRLSGDGAPATERALCEEFNVSRTTVRMALAQLKHAGLLESRPGVGTQGVASPQKRHRVQAGANPLHEALGTKSRIVSLGEVTSSRSVANFFGIPLGSSVWHFLRVHSLDRAPLSVVDSYLPLEYGSTFTRAALKAPMHDLLWNRFGLRQARSVHTIRVARADIDIANHLHIALADPVLAIEARVYLDDGTPIRWIQNAFREDRYEYVAEMDWPVPTNFPRRDSTPPTGMGHTPKRVGAPAHRIRLKA